MLTIKAFTGLRSSELRGLIWSDLDLDAGKLTVQRQIDDEDRGERIALKTPAARRTPRCARRTWTLSAICTPLAPSGATRTGSCSSTTGDGSHTGSSARTSRLP